MATQTLRLAEIENGRAWVEVDFNDQNNQSLTARWADNLTVPVRIFVYAPNGKQLIDGFLQAGVTGEAPLVGGDRFNVVTQAPSVNLAS